MYFTAYGYNVMLAGHAMIRSSTKGREMARLTGLEPATPGVTGRYSNRLSYSRFAGGACIVTLPAMQ